MIEFVDIDQDTQLVSDNYSSHCRRLVTKIFFIHNKYLSENNINFDRIYVPHTIMNILSDATGFFNYGISNFVEDQPVGKLGDRLDIYINFSMARDQILFSFDKQLVRENKLDTLIDGKQNYNLQEVTLVIKSQFLV